MQVLDINGRALHWREDGDPKGAPVVFSNSLGTDLRQWDPILPMLPAGLRIIRYDKRGHGLSEMGPVGTQIADLAGDAAALIEHLSLGPVVFVGLSVGGMTGLQLSATRPDLVKAFVISNSAAQIGTPEMWQERTRAISEGGIEALADAILDRWFGPAFRYGPQVPLWRAMLTRQPAAGYQAICAAIGQADLRGDAAAIRRPVLGISGTHDLGVPPEATQATIDLIPGARMQVIEGAGHLPPVETPEQFAEILVPFLKEHAHG